ncbi:hypothetical protein DT076_16715 [Desertihabitans brevis]|uniref:Uncharacterized protein n=1 Tax=Desertihabitans brevis TaxID=2268447 RepID=A0A367YRW2_9ACTN|nr:hypothetical protein DT076_16715 [Desertihabitans brevis]
MCRSCRKARRDYWNQWNKARQGITAPLTDDELLVELEHLRGSDDPDSIARRLGYSSGITLARRLYRMDQRDLARVFDRAGAAAA